MCGSEQVPATVDLSTVIKPTGITVTKDSDSTSPTLTITASTSFTLGAVKIPVVDGDITITKQFAVSYCLQARQGTGFHWPY